MKIAIIVFGPPGTGKGTQADLCSDTFDLYHLDTSKFIRQMIYNPHAKKSAVLARERAFYESGKLCTPSWIVNMIASQIKKVARLGSGIVLSGSPRTEYEVERIIPLLEKLYGKRNIILFHLIVKPKTVVRRSLGRLICASCRRPAIAEKGVRLKRCSFCGGLLKKKLLDTPVLIAERIKEYEERTEPVYSYLKKRGYMMVNVSAEPLPYKIFEMINAVIKRRV